MGKKRRDGRVDMASKAFIGKDGEPLAPKFSAGKGKAKGFTKVSMGDGHSESEEEEEEPKSILSSEEEEDQDDDDATEMYAAGEEEGSEEEDEEARRELALEMAAVRQIHAERAAANGHAGSDDDEGEDEGAAPAEGSSGYRQPHKYDRAGMDAAFEKVIQRAPSGKRPGFVEAMTVTGAVACQEVVTDVHDDLQREAAFYDHCLKGVKTAFGKLDTLGLDYLRPSDYYAEMIKTDEHMSKVKEKLLFEKEKIGEKESKRKQRDNMKLGKKVQAEREQQKSIKKKQDLNAIKAWRTDRKKQRGDDGDGKGAAGGKEGLDQAMAGKYQAAKSDAKASAKDARFGFGGMKRKQKANNRESTDDMSQYSGRKNSENVVRKGNGPKNSAIGKGNVRKKRAGKSQRQGR